MDTQSRWVVFAITMVCMGQLIDGLVSLPSCFDDIHGCGVGVSNADDIAKCTCLEDIDQSVCLCFYVFCLLKPERRQCCPCRFPAFMGDNSPSTDFLDCVGKRDLRELKRLVKRAQKTSRKIAKKCPNGMDGCCEHELIEKADKLTVKIKELNAHITENCETEPHM